MFNAILAHATTVQTVTAQPSYHLRGAGVLNNPRLKTLSTLRDSVIHLRPRLLLGTPIDLVMTRTCTEILAAPVVRGPLVAPIMNKYSFFLY